MLDIKLLTFLDLCKTGSFTQTAANLHVTQPTVSQHIKYLENVYDIKLVYYHERKVTITSAGKLLQEFATSMSINDKKFKKRLKSSVQSSRELSFATTPIISEFILPSILTDFLEKYNYEKINMVVAESKEALNKLYQGEIDFVITDGSFRARNYKCAQVFREETIAVCSQHHHYAKRCISFSDLIDERLIYRSKSSEAYNNLEIILTEKGYSIEDFNKTMTIGSITAIKELVKNNAGISFLYKFAVKNELKEGSLVKIDIQNFSIFRDIYFVWLKDSFYNNDAFVLYDYCRRFFSDYLRLSQSNKI